MATEVTITPTTYTVSILPESSGYRHLYAIRVERHLFGDWWAIIRRDGWWLNDDGGWDPPHQPGEHDADWLTDARHLFTFPQAVTLATAAAPNVEYDGITAAHMLASLDGSR